MRIYSRLLVHCLLFTLRLAPVRVATSLKKPTKVFDLLSLDYRRTLPLCHIRPPVFGIASRVTLHTMDISESTNEPRTPRSARHRTGSSIHLRVTRASNCLRAATFPKTLAFCQRGLSQSDSSEVPISVGLRVSKFFCPEAIATFSLCCGDLMCSLSTHGVRRRGLIDVISCTCPSGIQLLCTAP